MQTSMIPNPPILRELRCGCGNLMARILDEGIELKCRRCKRVKLIPLGGIAAEVRKRWSRIFQAV